MSITIPHHSVIPAKRCLLQPLRFATLKSEPEIERRFLVREIPKDLEKNPFVKIKQGYVVNNGEEEDYRLRRTKETINGEERKIYFYTVKKPTNDVRVRDEAEVQISKVEFDRMWEQTGNIWIKKKRFFLEANQLCKNGYYELDKFKGDCPQGKSLKGLHIAEVEFNSIQDCLQFTPPDWFGEEITDKKEYKTKNLARYGLPKESKK